MVGNIKFSSTGDRTRSPASQVCTLPKELSRQLILSVMCASHLTAKEGSNL